ncbi:MAG: hypothetical protein C0518_04610 [Opitutus sp.]|nr:hypothetical protein [Opitutus sp.]
MLAWLCANGAVWNVVQVVAWAKMFRDYAEVLPTAQALRLTFAGEACELCHFAQAGQDAARDQLPRDAALGASDRLLLVFQAAPPLVMSPPEFAWPGLVPEIGRLRWDGVPVPPPRV